MTASSRLSAFLTPALRNVAMPLLAGALLLPAGAWAASAADQLRTFVSGTQSATGSFTQTTKSTGAGQGAPAQSGTFSFQRPGKFKWQVIKPYEQLIVSDGKQLFQYDPDLMQVTVRPVGDAIGSSPASILFGSGSLEQSFNVATLPAKEGVEWLRATPKSPDAGFSRVDIGFKDGMPAQLELLDAFGQTTQVSFANMVRNPAVSADSFQFVAPKGVDVVKMGQQHPGKPAAR